MFPLMFASLICGFLALKYFLYFCRIYLEGMPVKARVIGYRGLRRLPVIEADIGAGETVSFTLARKFPARFLPGKDGKLGKISFSRFNPSKSLVGCYSIDFVINYVYAIAFGTASQYFYKTATKFKYVIGPDAFIVYTMCGCAVYYLWLLWKKRRISFTILRERIFQHERKMERAYGSVAPISPKNYIQNVKESLVLNLLYLFVSLYLFLFSLPLMLDENANIKIVENRFVSTLNTTVTGFEQSEQKLPFDFFGIHRYQMVVSTSNGERFVIASRPENFSYKIGDVAKVTPTGNFKAFIKREAPYYVVRAPQYYLKWGFLTWRRLSFVFLTLSIGSFFRALMRVVKLFQSRQRVH